MISVKRNSLLRVYRVRFIIRTGTSRLEGLRGSNVGVKTEFRHQYSTDSVTAWQAKQILLEQIISGDAGGDGVCVSCRIT
eukprot:5449515-Amphidinium_carterae.1